MYKNKVGLEAEFLLRDGEGNLVFPADHGFGYDEWPILAEIRGDPGEDTPTAVSNLMKELLAAMVKAAKKELQIDLTGWATVTPEVYKDAMKRMGTKVVPECQNIYGTDIIDYDDRVVEDGRVKSVNLSTGLHIHFSSREEKVTTTRNTVPPVYEPVNLEFKELGVVSLYRKVHEEREVDPHKVHLYASRITKPVVRYIVAELDGILKTYTEGMPPLKYRMPGFYELKSHGFEYRSLPFSQKVLDNLWTITEFAFETLRSIDL